MTTPNDFIDVCAEYLSELYARELLPTSEGEQVAPAIYKQELPFVESTTESLPDEYPSPPYIMPKIMDWNGRWTGEPRSITVRIIYCIYDDDKRNQGQRTILHLQEMLYQAIAEHPLIGNYAVDEDSNFTAAITEEDNYPYYFGGVEFTVLGAAVIREDELA